ncbi:hypothetical protein SAMN06269173_104138 [Hymenobacter mucosus]|uniref:Uncharacterized protein n=1 Tax=Hymenobacter mucosus TaxID=1411120 RepID=A0A238XJC4_9BACT|nr:hypothetical protein SAMN06269173_104138 [Hymenobacter mucosus]
MLPSLIFSENEAYFNKRSMTLFLAARPNT